MGDSNLYSTEDIEKLKQKISIYRDTLRTLKTGNSVDDYLFMKSNFNGYQTKFSDLENSMERLNDKKDLRIKEYEQQIENLSQQVNSFNQTVEGLNQELSTVKKKLSDESVDKKNSSEETQGLKGTVNRVEQKAVIEETVPVQKRRVLPSVPPSGRPESFSQVKSLLGRAGGSQNIPQGGMPPRKSEAAYSQHVPQQGSRQSFPSVGASPSQMYGGLGRPPRLKSNLHFNNVSTKQSVSMERNDNSTQAVIVPMNEQATKEIVMADTLIADQVALIEEEVTPVAVIEEEVTPLPSIKKEESVEEETSMAFIEEAKKLVSLMKEVKNPVAFFEEAKNLVAFIKEQATPETVIEEEESPVAVVDEEAIRAAVLEEKVIQVAAVEVKEPLVAVVEEEIVSIEHVYPMKRQQYKNKESLSLFNLFRKRS
ncbi:hypothetical protein [Sporosarcina sp. NPDC096371]|uniref:hypothetical protein n=1 Tax=Sporosarcina sp. NPDC096371 TaxID=3364530 RepID=UPI003811D6F3